MKDPEQNLHVATHMVRLKPAMAKILEGLAELSGRPRAAILRDWIEERLEAECMHPVKRIPDRDRNGSYCELLHDDPP